VRKTTVFVSFLVSILFAGLAINAVAATFAITTTSLPLGITTASYKASISATGGNTPYTWNLTAGALPGGLTLDASTGLISGTPSTAGTFAFDVRVSDSSAQSLTSSFSINVVAPSAPPETGSKGIWISPSELALLPMAGPAWDNVKAQADSDCGTPNLADQESLNDTCVLAKALLFARTGIESYRSDVRSQLAAAINTELLGDELALGRNLVSYVIAADLIGLPSYDAAFDQQTFRPWLLRTLSETLSGLTLISCDETKSTNWGTACGASREAADIYLGDTTDLARAAQVFQGYLGDRSAYAGFSYSTSIKQGVLTWTPLDSTQLVPVNPKDATVVWNGGTYPVGGALITEMVRGGPFQWPPIQTSYPWTGLGGAIVQAEILFRAGFPSYDWSGQAIRRAYEYLLWLNNATGGFWFDGGTSGHDNWQPWIANFRYGTDLPHSSPTTPGWNMGWTDWTHTRPPTITSFAPATGPAGTVVTVTGSGFSGTTAVAFAGTPATAFTVSSGAQITATVPASATTGKISVTNPAGTATAAANFIVTVQPSISSFSPTGAAVGATVTIDGAGFDGTTGVSFNGTSATTFTVVSGTEIMADVPVGTTSGPISVMNSAGTGISATNFSVTSVPVISSFTPASGPAGTSVTLTGANFSGATGVTFSGKAASTFTVDADTQITVSVPVGGTTGKIAVTTSSGTGSSATDFTVIVSSVISSFTPTSGPAGTTVTLTGTGFTGATGVTFNGAAATFTVNTDAQITVTVPAGATTGKIAVTNPAGTATSAANYTVIILPVISSFTPTSGPAGTTVTVTGSGFTGATGMTFNGAAAAFTVNTDSQITATVPAGAATGKIAVTNPAGTATSATNYTVIILPVISSFTPTSGPAGTTVTLTGTGFTGATRVTFNGAAATTFTVNTDAQIKATVPAGAATGKIAVTNPAGTGISATDFTVIVTPVISSFTPTSGPRGTQVTILGSGFTGATKVTFGTLLSSFVVDSDAQIRAIVPPTAKVGAVFIRVSTAAGKGQSSTKFTVTAGP
jgi:hypothetical protein